MKRDFAVSSHAANDDLGQWAFVRNSRLPRDAFDAPRWERLERVGERILVTVTIVGLVVIAICRLNGWL